MMNKQQVNAANSESDKKTFTMEVTDKGLIKMTFIDPIMGRKGDDYIISDGPKEHFLNIKEDKVMVADTVKDLDDPDILLKCNKTTPPKTCIESDDDGNYHAVVTCESTLL